MKALTILGIALILLGALGLAYEGFTYTQREQVVDAGPLEIHAEDRETIPIPPLLAGIAIVAGIGLMLYDRRGGSG